MIRCHNCRTDNLDGSEYCDECGVRLHAAPENTGSIAAPQTISPAPPPQPPPQPPPLARPDPVPERRDQFVTGSDMIPPEPPVFVRTKETPRPVVPATPPIQAQSSPPAVEYTPPPPAKTEDDTKRQQPAMVTPPPIPRPSEATAHLDSRGSGTMSLNKGQNPTAGISKPHAKLVVSRGGNIGNEFPVVGPEAQIGRWDADNGIFPDIDLDQHDPEAKVSRRHARIIADSGQYMVEDLGSTNGTFVNRGRRLIPGKRQPLRSGDELIIGKTFLKFVIEN